MNRYFYIDNEGKQKGTFSVEELKNEPIKQETLLWTQGMDEWMQAQNIAELQSLFSLQMEPSSRAQSIQPQPIPTNSGCRESQPMPKTYMTETILATILPFLFCGNIISLLGIIGIVHASKVEPLYLRGAYAESQEASRQAARWAKIALWIAIIGLVLFVLAIIAMIVFFGSMTGLADIMNG